MILAEGQRRQITPRTHFFFLGLLLAIAVLIRGPWIGDPLLHVDDQFYLLVADRMWQGDLPYVAIWDRKPIGLFLLYASFRPLSENGIVAYQIAALLFATATAAVIVRLALRLAPLPAAVAAGVLYIVYIPALGGNGGQSPVFYNLFMAGAALLIVRATERASNHDSLGHGLLAMLLVGLAIQVKYTSFVEGIFFGLWLSTLQWYRYRRSGQLLCATMLFAFCALLPTFAALAFFALKGAGWAFVQANFISIFQAQDVVGSKSDFLYWTCVKIAPLAAIFLVSLLTTFRRMKKKEPLTTFFVIWFVFAFLGFVVIGRFYSHYALPLIVPMILIITPLFRRPVVTGLVIGCCLSFAVMLIIEPAAASKANDRRYIHKMIEVLTPYALKGCIYLRDGPPIVYLMSHSCLPTPYVFPEHLTTILESRATRATEAMKKLVDSRPSAIVLSDREMPHQSNPETMAMLSQLLSEHYRLDVTVVEPNGVDKQSIYVRLD